MEFRGIRTNNLNNIDAHFPPGSITVIAGPSGCGKSSLAFDTVFAESKRQFLDSLGLAARQHFQHLPRPEFDEANGILPIVCLEQSPPPTSARSTVATLADIYDYIRLLMARVGEIRCSSCSRVIHQASTDQIEQEILALPERTKVMVLASPKTDSGDVDSQFEEIRKAGYVRIRCNQEICEIDTVSESTAKNAETIEAIIDRIIVKPGIEGRIAEAVSHAIRFGSGTLTLMYQLAGEDTWHEKQASTLYRCPNCGESYEEIEPRTFSFFSPFGVCISCEGLGEVYEFDLGRLFENQDPHADVLWSLSLLPDPIAQQRKNELQPLLDLLEIKPGSRIKELSNEQKRELFYGKNNLVGLELILNKTLATATETKLRNSIEELRGIAICSECGGSRLCTAANHVFIAGLNIGNIVSKTISESISFFQTLSDAFDSEATEIAAPITNEILNRLRFLERVGVGYLTLSRPTDTLSGGEVQRIRLASGLGNRLTDVGYVLDEPTSGLHPGDTEKLVDVLKELKQAGNSLIIVEHDSEILQIADHILELGPGAGKSGGNLLVEGSLQELIESPHSVTAKYLNQSGRTDPFVRREIGSDEKWGTIVGCTLNNLQNVSCRIPLERLVCVTGVSGSGKSSLITHTLIPALRQQLRIPSSPGPFESLSGFESIQKVVEIDQRFAGRSPRSNAATFTGIWDEIRKVFASTRLAKKLGFTASRFSFNNAQGACSVCKGQGRIRVDMKFMPDLYTTCESCNGKRFNQSTLSIRFKDLNVNDVLNLSVLDTRSVFENLTNIRKTLDAMEEVGLGYLVLGQPATSLSGGEIQRLKIANQLAKPGMEKALISLDEPTRGLHFSDVDNLCQVLNRLVDQGHTVVVIEHNLDLIAVSDYVVDFGPQAGEMGGQIVDQGTPEKLSESRTSITGRFLKQRLSPK